MGTVCGIRPEVMERLEWKRADLIRAMIAENEGGASSYGTETPNLEISL
jgi:hypothetical protein